MRKDEAAKLLPIIKAFSEGKEVQYKANGRWYLAEDIAFFGGGQEFRIKPESKYRPFVNAEECWQEMQKHQPFGWLKLKCEDTAYGMLTLIKDKGVVVGINDTPFSYHHLFYNYTFADRQPFGVKED